MVMIMGVFSFPSYFFRDSVLYSLFALEVLRDLRWRLLSRGCT